MDYKDYRFGRMDPDYKMRPGDLERILRAPSKRNLRDSSQRSQYRQIWNYLKSGSARTLRDLPRDLQKIAFRMLREREHTLAMKRLGLDVGTKNIVLARRVGDKIVPKKEVNGFYKMPVENAYAKNMLKQLGVPFISTDDGKSMVALGEQAERIAVTFGGYLRRPMERGTLSVSETEAMQIMAVIVRSIIGDLEEDSILYYCVPADAINEKTNVGYHEKVVQAIIDGYQSDGGKLQAYSINEARALVFSQFESKTGIGVSCGAGMINVSYCLLGLPVYEFSIVGAGDWIDTEAARATGNLDVIEGVERPKALVAEVKESIDLTEGMPTDNLRRAIYLHYQLLVERIASSIVRGFLDNQNKAQAGMPMPIVLAGGTASPNGFEDLFTAAFEKQDMPFEVGEIRKAERPLFAVAEGCLEAAEMHEEV